jgi:hypothetical protein
MTIKPKLTSVYLALAATAGFAMSTASSQAQSASATISGTAVAGGYNYTITLTDTTGGNIDSFWYGWTVFGNNLPSIPSSAGNSLGWANDVSGNSIMWLGGTAMTPNQKATFTFFSTSTPGAITTSPSGESVTYVGGIDFSSDGQGVFSPVLVATPEPSSLAMMAVGSLGLLGAGWRKFRKQG